MALFDLPHDELRRYRPELPIPADLDTFWARTLNEARSYPLQPTFAEVDNHLSVITSYDVSFAGFGGTTVRAWLHLPTHRESRLPAVVQYAGYNGGRGLAHENIFWAAAGYAHLIVDTRGQGAGWMVGDTADEYAHAGNPSIGGFMTRGILDPDTYYYRRVYTDAVRAVEAVRVHPAVDPTRIVVVGGSQGGGIALAVAALVDGLAGICADVPFLCDFPRATSLVDTEPYVQIRLYLKTHRDKAARVFDTLSYFDGAVLAQQASAPALFSVALMDQTCPPSSVYAAYNHYAGAKQLRVYPFNDHEGGGPFQQIEQARWLAELLKP